MAVNCQPARPLCWPVLAPAQTFVRAGERRRGETRNAELGRGDERIRLSGSVAEFCRWFMSAFAVLPRRFPRRMLVLAVLSRHLSSVYPFLCGAVEAISSARIWLCGSIGASCLRFTPAFEVLLRCLSSVYPCLCGAVEAISSARVWLCGSVGAFCLRFTPAFEVLLRRFAFGSRLLFAAWRQTGRLAIRCVSIPQSRDRLRAFSRRRRGYLPWRVHFGFGRFFMAISTGLPGTRERGTGLAARRLCVFAQSHWHCEFFRGEYAGAARPRLRQRVFDSLDSLHAAAGLCWCVVAALVRLCAATLAL